MARKNLLNLAITILLVGYASSFNLYNRIDISNKTGAACLDGSNAAFYIWFPQQEDKPVNKVLIYFEQTPFGWCVQQDLATSVQRCHKWMTQDNLDEYTSTNDWSGSFMVLTGILSPFDGGQFSMWTKVIIRSCDGGAYMGNREPIQYKKKKMHFKGSINVQEVFKYLQTKKLLTNRQQIVLSGSMNGAVAAMNYIQILKKYTNSPIRMLVDSAIHLDEYNRKTNRSQIQNRMKMIQKLFLNDASPPHKICTDANPQSVWRCLFGYQLQKHITVPIFYTQSLYDGWSIDQILGFKCAEQFASLSECQEWERQVIKEYHQNVTKIMRQITKKQGSGAFGISCVAHQFVKGRWNNEMFQIPMNSGNMVINATNIWLKTKKSSVHIDEVNWPQNKPCARKIVKPSNYLIRQ